MKSVVLVLLALVAICHSKTIPWVKKQPAMVLKNLPETVPWVEKQPAMIRKKMPETIPWFEKQPAMPVHVRKNVQETIQPAMIRKTAPESIPWMTKQPAIKVNDGTNDITCPDQVSLDVFFL